MIGPLVYRMGDGQGGERTCTGGPFKSTLEYLRYFLNLRTDGTKVFDEVKVILESHLAKLDNSLNVHPPFRLIHADFDGQNLLFTGGGSTADGHESPPRLSGVIDWEFAYTGPVHFLYKFPIFIQDSTFDKAAYSDNAILRPHFVRALREFFPKGSSGRIELNPSIKVDYILNQYHILFVVLAGGPELEMFKKYALELYVSNVHEGTKDGYYGRDDYSSDGDVPSDSD